MSQDHLEIVKRALDAFNRQDLDAYDELFTSDFAGFPSMAGIVAGDDYRGRDGFAMFLIGVRDTWDEFRVLDEQFRVIGGRVLVLCRIAGRARRTGVGVDALGAMLFEFRAGKISGARDYLDRSEAMRAAWLGE
jgi:ketosteroid isomerase-like protein